MSTPSTGDSQSPEMARSKHNRKEANKNGAATNLERCPLLVHLDLKGAPPTADYLSALFPLFREWGATGIVFEWEDMLPFTGSLYCIRNPEHYTEEEVNMILKAAHASQLDAIPLVQTFGHLEFVLKHPQFSHLREEPDNHMDLCPLTATEGLETNGEIEDSGSTMGEQLALVGAKPSIAAQTLVRELMEQVIGFHKRSGIPLTHIHVGGDEVFSLGSNPLTAAAVAVADGEMTVAGNAHPVRSPGSGLQQLFLDHICSAVLPVVGQHGLTAMLWHDMLDRCPAEWLKRLRYEDPKQTKSKSRSSNNFTGSPCPVEVVVWAYTPDIADALPADTESGTQSGMWQRFADAKLPLWGASAFKGASSPDAIFTPVMRHLNNHLSWASRSAVTPLQGMILTGWTRFNHTAALCETLPAGIPSLALNLSILRELGKERNRAGNLYFATFYAGSATSGAMLQQPVSAHREVVRQVHRRVFRSLGLVSPHGSVVSLSPSISQLSDLPQPNEPMREPFMASTPTKDSRRLASNPNSLFVQSRFPGGELWRLLGQLEGAKSQFLRVQENRRLFCPPFTNRLNPPLWRRIEQHARSIANLAASLRAPVIAAGSLCLTAGSVSEIISAKVDVLERECHHIADELGRWRNYYCPPDPHAPQSSTMTVASTSPSAAPSTPASFYGNMSTSIGSVSHTSSTFQFAAAAFTRAPPASVLADTPHEANFQVNPPLSQGAVANAVAPSALNRAAAYLRSQGVNINKDTGLNSTLEPDRLVELVRHLRNASAGIASETNEGDRSFALSPLEARASLLLLLPLLNEVPKLSGKARVVSTALALPSEPNAIATTTTLNNHLDAASASQLDIGMGAGRMLTQSHALTRAEPSLVEMNDSSKEGKPMTEDNVDSDCSDVSMNSRDRKSRRAARKGVTS